MTKVAEMEWTINGLQLDWNEDSKRKARPCFGCKAPTKGRARWDGPPSASWIGRAACVGCAIADTVKTIKAGE
jgi:hypothetical protein